MHDIKRIVKHKIFGIGTIKAQNETKIWVKFENKDHLLVFDYPKEDYTNFFVFIDQTGIKQKELVDVLVKYIIYNDKTVFPKEELFNFCSKRFSNIVSEDLSQGVLSIVIQEIEKRTKKLFRLHSDNSISRMEKENKDESNTVLLEEIHKQDFILPSSVNFSESHVNKKDDNEKGVLQDVKCPLPKMNEFQVQEIFQNPSNHKKNLIDFLSTYLLKNRPFRILRTDLATYASKNFYKGTNILPLKLSPAILEKVILETNKDTSIKYKLVNSKVIIKLEDSKNQELVSKKTSEERQGEENLEQTKQLIDSRKLMELIKPTILTEVKPKQAHTVNEIKQYIVKNYHMDVGNLVTKNILIDVCKELYKEKNKYYFVDADGNELQICRTTSLQEWQYYGLGTVYNPKIKVKDKEFNIQDFTLYIYESLNSVICGKAVEHKTENVTINTTDISSNLVSFNAYYCHKCQKYFTSKATIEDIFPKKNYPFLKFKLLYTKDYELKPESVLHIYGYTTKVDGPSQMQRENLLAKLLIYDIVTKKDVEGLLWHLINHNGRKKNMANAKTKWESDLEFVRNFNLREQTQINVKRILFK